MSEDPEKDALKVLEDVWRDRPLPVDPVYIARELGVEVFVAELAAGWSGALVKRSFEDAEIFLNRGDSLNRQRFSCAHELGHWVRRGAVDQDTYEYVDRRDARASSGTHAEEIYANQFAAALLMPVHEVRQAYEEGVPASLMAYRFGVSAEAMNFRIKNLRLS